MLLVHHTGKEAGRGMRGHSSLLAAMDCVIEVKRKGDEREWHVVKSKDGEDGASHPFKLESSAPGNPTAMAMPSPRASVVPTQSVQPVQPVATKAPKLDIYQGTGQQVVFNGSEYYQYNRAKFKYNLLVPRFLSIMAQESIPNILLQPVAITRTTRQPYLYFNHRLFLILLQQVLHPIVQ